MRPSLIVCVFAPSRVDSSLRAADEIIDEGHFIGKALGEGLNGYRPIVELMNTNFGIFGIAEVRAPRERASHSNPAVFIAARL